MKLHSFYPNRLVFESLKENPESLPDNNLSKFSGNIADFLTGDDSSVEVASRVKKIDKLNADSIKFSGNIADFLTGMDKLNADLIKVVTEDQFGVFRTGTNEGEYLIISGRDGETIGKINTVIMNGVPTIEVTQFIPIYTPDLKSYTFEEKVSYYKTAAEFKADLGIFTEDLRKN